MKYKSVISVLLLGLIISILPFGNLYAAGISTKSDEWNSHSPTGADVNNCIHITQVRDVFLPLVMNGKSETPPLRTVTPTPTKTLIPEKSPTSTATPTNTPIPTEPLPPPAPPSDLTATAISTDTVQLAWTDNSTSEAEFIIEDSLDGVTYVYNDTTGAPDVTIVDVIELLPNTYYCFRVFARNDNGDSNISNAACAATLADGPPEALTNLTAEVISPTRSLLTWTNNSFCDGYNIYESRNGSEYFGVGYVEVYRPGTYVDYPPEWTGDTFKYKVRAYNLIDSIPVESPDSNVSNEITLPLVTTHTVTRFNNNAVYPVVSLQIDGVEHFPYEPEGILSGGIYQPVFTIGSHSYQAATGFWSFGSRTEMYVYTGTFTQIDGVSGTVNINDPSIAQILTRFGTSAYYAGEYWGDEYLGSIFHSKAFCFNSTGTYSFYWDGVFQGSGSYGMVSYPGNFQLSFQTSGYQNYQAQMDELGGYFYMKNGPTEWPVIQYNYAGNCPSQ